MSSGKDWSDDLSTVLKAAVTDAPVAGDEFFVSVVEGPDAGLRTQLDATAPTRFFIGQSPACELRLSDPLVSRRHASLDVTERGARLVDLDSTNGTFVNGVRVNDAYLVGGEIVRLGNTAIELQTRGASHKRLHSELRFGKVIGASSAMRRLYPLLERLAQSAVSVVIEGESGTGKELVAESLHDAGPRADMPFVVFDCTAVSPSLMESALFGHERGAFTGAVSARKGVFEQADGGTLFVDEIGDLDITLQPKLLRAIERGEVQRVGSDKWLKVDVRVLAATRRDLDREVLAGRFRDDLFYRLAVTHVELPPLRDRTGDVALLARTFWRDMTGGEELPARYIARFEASSWPGNVRELYNAVARLVALGDADSAQPEPPTAMAQAREDFLAAILEQELPLPRARERVVLELERRYVERVLAKYQGNVRRAAAASGIARRYFQLLRARSR